MIFEAKVKKWGNSLGIILPRKMVKEESIKDGEHIKVIAVQKKRRVTGFGLWKGAEPFIRDEKFLEGGVIGLGKVCIIDTYAWVEYLNGSVKGLKLKKLLDDENNSFITLESNLTELSIGVLKKGLISMKRLIL